MLKSLKMFVFIISGWYRGDVNRNLVGPLYLFRTPLHLPLPSPSPPACRVTLARSSAHTHVNMPQLCSDKDREHWVTDSAVMVLLEHGELQRKRSVFLHQQ